MQVYRPARMALLPGNKSIGDALNSSVQLRVCVIIVQFCCVLSKKDKRAGVRSSVVRKWMSQLKGK